MNQNGEEVNDVFFETILYHQGKMPLWDYHLQRINRTLELVKGELGYENSPRSLVAEIGSLCAAKNLQTAKVKVIFSISSRAQVSKNYFFDYKITCTPFYYQEYCQTDKIHTLCIFPNEKISLEAPVHFKSTDRNLYKNAETYATLNSCDLAIVLNTANRVVETTIANIFLVLGREIWTPPTSEGCVAGVFKDFLFQNFKKLKISKDYTLIEKRITIEDLHRADEIFCTNALRGMMLCKMKNSMELNSSMISKLLIHELLQN